MSSRLPRFKVEVLGVFACFLVAALIYAPAALVLPFSDDWQQSAWAEQHGLNLFFNGANFRFSTRAIFALGHPIFAEKIALLIVPISIAALLCLAWVLILAVKQIAPGQRWAPLCVAVFYLFHPANATAVIQVDTIGQTLADLMMVLSIYLVVFHRSADAFKTAALTALLALLTLFNKETGLGVLAWIPLAHYLRSRYVLGYGPAKSLQITLPILTAVLFGIMTFFLIRAAAGTPVSPSEAGRYSIHLEPLLILTNAAQLLACSLYFADIAKIFIYGWTAEVFAGMALSLALAVAAGSGLFHLLRRTESQDTSLRTATPDLLVWLSFLIPSLVPMILMGSVSDLYVAGQTPFIALAYGISFAYLLQKSKPGAWHKYVTLSLLPLACANGVYSIMDKQQLRRDASNQTWAYLRAVSPVFPACGFPNRTLIAEGALSDTTTGGRPYSSYSVMVERIMRSVLGGQADPYRRAWLLRAVSAQANASNPGGLADPQCSAQVYDTPTPACVIKCVPQGVTQTRLQRCRVFEERCADTRT